MCPHVNHLIGIISISTTGIKYLIDGLIGFCFIVVQSLLFWHVCLLHYKQKTLATDKAIFKGNSCMMSSV